MKILFFFILLLSPSCFGQNGKVICGHIIDEVNDPAVFVQVAAYKLENDSQTIVGGAYTDFDGNFRINGLEGAVYKLIVSGVIYDTVVVDDVNIINADLVSLDTIQIVEKEIEIYNDGILPFPIEPRQPVKLESEGIDMR